jgi:Ca2+/H+ antiporter
MSYLLFFVFFTLIMGYVPPFKALHIHPVVKFLFSLISTIPLAYYIGMALAR